MVIVEGILVSVDAVVITEGEGSPYKSQIISYAMENKLLDWDSNVDSVSVYKNYEFHITREKFDMEFSYYTNLTSCYSDRSMLEAATTLMRGDRSEPDWEALEFAEERYRDPRLPNKLRASKILLDKLTQIWG